MFQINPAAVPDVSRASVVFMLFSRIIPDYNLGFSNIHVGVRCLSLVFIIETHVTSLFSHFRFLVSFYTFTCNFIASVVILQLILHQCFCVLSLNDICSISHFVCVITYSIPKYLKMHDQFWIYCHLLNAPVIYLTSSCTFVFKFQKVCLLKVMYVPMNPSFCIAFMVIALTIVCLI